MLSLLVFHTLALQRYWFLWLVLDDLIRAIKARADPAQRVGVGISGHEGGGVGDGRAAQLAEVAQDDAHLAALQVHAHALQGHLT